MIIETILAAHKKRCLPITDTIEEVEEPSTLNDASAKGNEKHDDRDEEEETPKGG